MKEFNYIDLELNTVAQLKDYCRSNQLKGYSKLSKADLIDLVQEAIDCYDAHRELEAQANMDWDEMIEAGLMTEEEAFANSIHADEFESYEAWQLHEVRNNLIRQEMYSADNRMEGFNEFPDTIVDELNRCYTQTSDGEQDKDVVDFLNACYDTPLVASLRSAPTTLKQLKQQFTEITGVEAKAKPTRSFLRSENCNYLKQNELEELISLDLRRKDSWQSILDNVSSNLVQVESSLSTLPTLHLKGETTEITLDYKDYPVEVLRQEVNKIVNPPSIENESVDLTTWTKEQLITEKVEQQKVWVKFLQDNGAYFMDNIIETIVGDEAAKFGYIHFDSEEERQWHEEQQQAIDDAGW